MMREAKKNNNKKPNSLLSLMPNFKLKAGEIYSEVKGATALQT